MERRNFLRSLGLGTAVGVTAATVSPSVLASEPKRTDENEFIHNGYRVKWRDFITPVNQNVIVGVWAAKHETHDLQWASTTQGQCYPTRDWEVLDLSKAEGWPMLTIFSTAAERQVSKERALAKLLAKLPPLPAMGMEDE